MFVPLSWYQSNYNTWHIFNPIPALYNHQLYRGHSQVSQFVNHEETVRIWTVIVLLQVQHYKVYKESLISFYCRSNRSGYSIFPFYIGKIKITIFHFLLSCTIIFSLVWGFFIYSVVDAALKKAGDNYATATDKSDTNVKDKVNFYGTKFRIM